MVAIALFSSSVLLPETDIIILDHEIQTVQAKATRQKDVCPSHHRAHASPEVLLKKQLNK